MPDLALNSVEAVVILALCACAAGAAAIGVAAYRSAIERNGALALQASLGAVMLLISAVAFFNHQPRRRIDRAAPAWIVKYEPPDPPSREALKRRLEARAALRLERRRHEDDRQRAHERTQRERLLHQIATPRAASPTLATR